MNCGSDWQCHICQPSLRAYLIEENGEIHLHSNFLLDREGNSRSVSVAFVLHQGMLFSLRNDELPVFRLQRRRARTQPGYVSDCTDVLLDLYGADVEYSADSLEDMYATIGFININQNRRINQLTVFGVSTYLVLKHLEERSIKVKKGG